MATEIRSFWTAGANSELTVAMQILVTNSYTAVVDQLR